MNTFKLNIVIPDGEKFAGEASSLTGRTKGGDVQILAGHADYLAALGTGRVKLVMPDGEERLASASGGFISVAGGEVSVVTTTFEFADEIDLRRAELAKERAEHAIATAKTEAETKCAKAKLSRAISRITAKTFKY